MKVIYNVVRDEIVIFDPPPVENGSMKMTDSGFLEGDKKITIDNFSKRIGFKLTYRVSKTGEKCENSCCNECGLRAILDSVVE